MSEALPGSGRIKDYGWIICLGCRDDNIATRPGSVVPWCYTKNDPAIGCRGLSMIPCNCLLGITGDHSFDLVYQFARRFLLLNPRARFHPDWQFKATRINAGKKS